MRQEREIFEKLEEILAGYGGRQIEMIVSHKDLSPEQLFELRGKAKACKELAGSLRNTLGYDPESL